MGYINFTDQEKEEANNVDIALFLMAKGEKLKRSGQEYSWESPFGKISIRGNQWYSQYERIGGGAIKFVQKFYGMNYPDAIRALLGSSVGTEVLPKAKKEEKEIKIPEKNNDMKRVYAYLLGERCIKREILNEFVKRGLIYEDKRYHNVVFVGKDKEGTIKHIQKRSTQPASDFKGNVTGSDANYSFNFVGNSEKLYVFEAPIDMLAYISLRDRSDWKEHSYVALCSTADCAVLKMLENYPNITSVYLCLDHDSAGIEGACRIAEIIHARGDQEVWRIMPKNKDWDEDLKELHGKEFLPAKEPMKIGSIDM